MYMGLERNIWNWTAEINSNEAFGRVLISLGLGEEHAVGCITETNF